MSCVHVCVCMSVTTLPAKLFVLYSNTGTWECIIGFSWTLPSTPYYNTYLDQISVYLFVDSHIRFRLYIYFRVPLRIHGLTMQVTVLPLVREVGGARISR